MVMDMKKKKKKKKKKKVTLISSNGIIFDNIDLAMLSGCRVIKARIEEEEEEGCCGDGDDDDKIITLSVPEITGKILALVLEYCRKFPYHGEEQEEEEEEVDEEEEEEEDLRRWKAKLATEVDEAILAHLIVAADYLDMWELMSLAGKVMSRKGKTRLEIVEIFQRKLENEEEEVSREKLWA